MDSDQRICVDISSVTSQLSSGLYNGFYYTIFGFTAIARLALRVRVSYVFFCLGWVWVCLGVQERAVPARDTVS